MGQLNTNSSNRQQINLNEWIQAYEDNTNSLFNNVNPFRKRLLLNKTTHELIQQYQLQFLSEQDFSTYHAEVTLRIQQTWTPTASQRNPPELKSITYSPYISKVRYFSNNSVKQLCSTIYNGLLYINKVDLRLKEINDIPFQDQLYLYQVCLEGFKILYEKAGFFYITQEMIFFDQQGKAYVWMNPNLSRLEPNYDPIKQTSFDSNTAQGTQSEMLKTIITLIEQNTDSTATNIVTFSNYLQDRGLLNRLSFQKAIQQFHRYCGQYHLNSSHYMKAIHELYNTGQQSLHRSEVKRIQDVHDYELLQKSLHQLQPSFSFYGQSSKHDAYSQMQRSKKQLQINKQKTDALFIGGYGQLSRNRNQNMSKSQINHKHHGMNRNISATFIDSVMVPPIQSVNNSINQQIQSRHIIPFNFNKQQPIQTFEANRSVHKTQSIANFKINRPVTFRYFNAQPIINQPNIQQRTTNIVTNKPTPHIERKQSIIQQLNSPHFVKNINIGLPPQQNRNKLQPQSQQTLTNKQSNRLTYYSSSSEAYTLDSQIAEDIEKYLRTSPSLK